MTALLALSPLPPANELMENYHSFMEGVMIGNEKKKKNNNNNIQEIAVNKNENFA